MRNALRIFRKDVRHLWPRIAIVLAVELLVGWVAFSPPPEMANAVHALGRFGMLPCWYLIAALIHEEAVPGNRQYWLTRPFSWRELLAGKMIFILVFVCLPVFAGEVTSLALRGKSPLAYLPELLVSQLFFLATRVLPAAALASITTGLIEAVWVTLAAFVGFYVILLIQLSSRGLAGFDWGGLEWFRTTVVATLVLATSAAILMVQYARRQTWLSRGILVAALLIGTFLMWIPGWHKAFALQARLSGQNVADTVARIALGSGRDPRTYTLPGQSGGWAGQHVEGITMPVRVTGIPDGMALYSNRAIVTVATPDGKQWSSGWDSLNGLFHVVATSSARTEGEPFLPGDGEYGLNLNIDQSLLRRAGSVPMPLHARVALTLLSREQTTPLAVREGAQAVSNDGFCWVTSHGRQFTMACSWPARMPASFGFRLQPGGPDLWLASLAGDKVGSYGPYPTSGGIWQWASRFITTDASPAGVDLVTRTAVAHFERELDIPALGEWPK
jgi:hypothetical protein